MAQVEQAEEDESLLLTAQAAAAAAAAGGAGAGAEVEVGEGVARLELAPQVEVPSAMRGHAVHSSGL